MGLKSFFRRNSSRPHPQQNPKYDVPLTIKSLEEIFSDCSDFQSRVISIGGNASGQVTICYIDGLVDGNFLTESVIRPLTDSSRFSGKSGVSDCIEMITTGAVYSGNAVEKTSTDDVVQALVKGFAAVVFSREKRAVVFEVRSGIHRAVSIPTVEKAVKGAKDSFVESIRINTTLIRRKLSTPDLKIVRTMVGRRSDTEVDLVYLEGIANPQITGQVLERLRKIDIDGVLATGNLEEYLSDNPYSPFPQITYTERPDRFAINLLEGRVGILADGIPLGFLVPCTIAQIMRVPEDRSQHFLVSSFLRFLRYLAAVITILLPAFYVAIALYHQEMIPLPLLLSIIDSKQGVPFSVEMEIIGMLIAFELLQEAGLRLPNPVGETVGIIGALIVGQSAVEAKVISPLAVIVVAAAGITGYTIPNQDLSAVLRLCRFFMVICALFAGMFGIISGLILIAYHLCRLESFGVPYLSPLADGGPLGLFRTLFRKPFIMDKDREPDLSPIDKRNQR